MLGDLTMACFSYSKKTGIKSIFIFTFFWMCLATCFLTDAFALTDYQRKQITDNLDHPKMKMNTSIFDGTHFVAGTDKAKAGKYYKDYVYYLKRALRGWKMLSSSDKGSPEAQEIFARLEEKSKWGQAMQKAYPTFSANKGVAKGATDTKRKQVPSSGGGMTSYQKQSVTHYLDGKNMRQDTTIFDGKNFVKGAAYQKVKQYYNGFIRDLNNANNKWNSNISPSAKGSADGKALLERLNDASEWARAMEAQYPAYEKGQLALIQANKDSKAKAKKAAQADKAEHQKVCRSFMKQAMLPLNRDPITRLIQQLKHNNQKIGTPEQVETHAKVAAQVDSVCKGIDYAKLTSKPCYYVINGPHNDPVNWCEAAAKSGELIKAAALNSAKQTISIVGTASIQSPKEFMDRDGWLTFEGKVTYKDKLFFSSHGRENVMGSVKSLLASVGVENAEETLWGEQKGRLDTLRKEVEKTAGTWKSPEEKAGNYSTKLARNQIQKMHPDAKIHKAYLSRASYKIHKNALGVPLRKTMPGYILFKLPDDPFCQLRSYTLTEQYEGGGKYQKASGVRIGYVRFQKCP